MTVQAEPLPDVEAVSLDVPVGIAVGHNTEPFQASVEAALEFEALGLDFVTAGDSGAETFSMLAAVAARSSRLGLMSSIATWSRSPVTMAHAAQTVHNLSDGRYRLGIGPMPRMWAQDWHGLQFDPVLPRMREYLTAVRACLDATGDRPTDVDGQYFASHGFEGHRTTPQRRVPMYLAATLPRMVSMATELTDGVMLNSIHPLEWLTGPGGDLMAQGLERSGRDRSQVEIGILRFCGIDDDRAAAYDNVRRSIAFYFSIPYLRTLLEPFGFEDELAAGEAALAAGDDDARYAAVSDRMVDSLGIAGTPGEVLAKIQSYGEHVDFIQLAGAFNVGADVARAQNTRLAELVGGARRLARAASEPAPAPVTLVTPAVSATVGRGYAGALGEQVHYRERPGDDGVIVFFHQTASSSAMWERVLSAYPAGPRLIALDTPGFGASDRLPVQADIADYAARMRTALGLLGVERAVLVGHHTGAVMAGEIAAQAPEFVQRLMLLGPVVIPDDATEAAQTAAVNRWQIDARGDYVVEHVIPRLLRSVIRDDPQHMQSELVSYLQAGAEYTRGYDAVWRYRAADRLPLITAPTRVVIGSDEMTELQDWAVAATALIPGVRYVSLPGVGSEMAFEEPALVVELISDFVGGGQR